VCPVHLEATQFVGLLSSVTQVPSEKLPKIWNEQFEPVSDGKVDAILCNMQPRVETLLQSVPIN